MLISLESVVLNYPGVDTCRFNLRLVAHRFLTEKLNQARDARFFLRRNMWPSYAPLSSDIGCHRLVFIVIRDRKWAILSADWDGRGPYQEYLVGSRKIAHSMIHTHIIAKRCPLRSECNGGAQKYGILTSRLRCVMSSLVGFIVCI